VFAADAAQSTIQAQIQRELLITHGISTNDRRTALQIARSLQSQLFFYEVEWTSRLLQDSVEDVYMFLDDMGPDGADARAPDLEELPSGVILRMTKCYSPGCSDEDPCYAFVCPRKVRAFCDAGGAVQLTGCEEGDAGVAHAYTVSVGA
jgi:hypothetical protein